MAPTKTIDWVVKASKFCNLRCSYCYEWDQLGDRGRMSSAHWSRVLDAVRDYHRHIERETGRPAQSRVIWHGGEPLTLPYAYLREVMALQRRKLGGIDHRILMQTNLYSVSAQHLKLLRQFDVGLGVSLDLFGGVRTDVRGRETDTAVIANLDVLRSEGIAFGAITVVGQHNHRRLRDVYDFWAQRRVDFRVLPLFDGPASRPAGLFELPEPAVVAALNDLFDHWIRSGAVVDVLPLSDWLMNMFREVVGQRVQTYDRRLLGESVLLVETAGDLYLTDERGQREKRLGNVVTESMDEILRSPAYAASLRRTETKSAAVCGGCRHYGYCSGYDLHAEPIAATYPTDCPVTASVQDHIKAFLVGFGYRRPDSPGPLGPPLQTVAVRYATTGTMP